MPQGVQLFAMQCNYLGPPSLAVSWDLIWQFTCMRNVSWIRLMLEHENQIFSKHGWKGRLYLSIAIANRRQEEGLLEEPETTHGELQRLHLNWICAVGAFLQLKPQIMDLFCLCIPSNYCLLITFSNLIYDTERPDTGEGENLKTSVTDESWRSVPKCYQI